MPGGVGPNLTDDHWIHGGSIASIFKTIKYGWPEKGMISWKDQLTPNQIAQLSSFIRSIAGSNPPGAKEPEGDVWVEGLAPSDSSKDSSTKSISKDSVKVIK
jgi:cytochrome c oxidase cbb3-type subunit 3